MKLAYLHILVLIIVSNFSCSKVETKKIKTKLIENKKIDSLDIIKKNKLIGIWGENVNDNATFVIDKDSIFYFDNDEYFKYKTSKDSIFIYYDEYLYKAKFIIEKDSLTLYDEFGTTKFVCLKE